jgi:hypothetical protein
MRCIACNKIIDEFYIRTSGQDEYCDECMYEVTKILEGIEEEEIEFISIDDLEDEI